MKKPAKKPQLSISQPDRKYQVEDAMRTLMRAEELKKDKAIMRDVQKMAKEQAAKMSGLCGKGK